MSVRMWRRAACTASALAFVWSFAGRNSKQIEGIDQLPLRDQARDYPIVPLADG